MGGDITSAEEFRDLLNNIDINDRYNLRRTSGRLDRLHTFLSDPSGNMTPPTQPPPSSPTQPPQTTPQQLQQQMYNIAQTTRSLPMARFTGFVPESVPNRAQLMSYDVNRWLCDSENRAEVKHITDDILKIKEAKLAVATDVGDAAVVLNTGRMNEIVVYEDFKRKCLKFWRSASERDRYHALSGFLSVEYSTSMGVFASNLERARMSVLEDLKSDTTFTYGDAASWAAGTRGGEILVSLNEVVNYFSWGVLFKAVPPSFREALRKVKVKYDDDYLDILSSVQSEMYKLEKGIKLEVTAYANNSQNSHAAVKCHRCEKQGHISRDCHVSVKCGYCHKDGHITSNCFAAKRKSSGKSGKQASSSNVVDEDERPINVNRN